MAKFDVTSLKLDDRGLIPTIVQDFSTGEVLMMAWMNEDAISQTLETGTATFWSRSRQCIWVKGLTSGNTQKIRKIRIDCDRDCLLLLVTPNGPACHTNRRHCFYTEIQNGHESILIKPET